MQVVASKIQNWTPVEGHAYQTEEGYTIKPEVVADVCKYNSVPATLVQVDKKYGTRTTKNVLQVALKEDPKFVIDDDGKVLSALNPKSQFMTDDEFEVVLNDIKALGYDDLQIKRSGASIRTTIEVPAEDKDSLFNNDIFRKRVIVERLDEGGILFNVALLRQVCTNGQLVADSQFKKHLHKSTVAPDITRTFFADALMFNINEYFQHLWTKNGEPVMASVSDYFGMKGTLAKMADDDSADFAFPEQPIIDHYASQEIDVTTLPRTMLAKLPSGISYYDCYNFLTHGAKFIQNRTIKDEIEIANWAKPSKLDQMKQSDICFKGAPYFSPDTIKQLRGDISE